MLQYNSMEMLQHGGITLAVLFLCSVFLIAIVIERFYFFQKERVNKELLLTHISSLLAQHDFSSAINLCNENPGFLTRVISEGLERHNLTAQRQEDAMKIAILEENSSMEKFIPFIGTAAVIAPFIGLFGTVLGIIRAFEDIAKNRSTGPEIVSRGVAEALVATAAGLLVAIVAVIFFNYFKNKIKQINLDLSITASKVIELIENSSSSENK